MPGFSHTVCWQFSHVFVLRVRNRAETLFELQQKSKFRLRGRLCIIGYQTAMIRKTTPERLSFFSDAIFAVLITVLVLELHPPERPTFEALLERWPTWLSYAVSYLLRVLDSIQLTARHKVATPVNWKPGGDVIISGAVSDDEAKRLYPEGWKAPKPYLQPHCSAPGG